MCRHIRSSAFVQRDQNLYNNSIKRKTFLCVFTINVTIIQSGCRRHKYFLYLTTDRFYRKLITIYLLLLLLLLWVRCVSYAYMVTLFGTATRDVFTVTQRNKYALTTTISYPIPPQYALIYKSITVCAYRSNLLIVHFQYINCNLYTLKCRMMCNLWMRIDRCTYCIACKRTRVMIARVVNVS